MLGTGKDRGSEAFAAYGAKPDHDVLELFIEARAFQAAVWGIVLSDGRYRGNTRARLRWLRSRAAAQRPRS